MKKNTLLVLTIATLFAITAPLKAATVTFYFANMYDSSNNLLVDNALGVIVEDTAGDGFQSSSLAGSTLSIGNFVGANDKIVDIIHASAGAFDDESNTSIPFVSPGHNLNLYWFPTILTIGSTVGSSVSYGSFTSAVANINSGGTSGMVSPNPGDTSTIAYVDTDVAAGTGISPKTSLKASFTTVPEPSSFALLTGGLLMAGSMIRRRK